MLALGGKHMQGRVHWSAVRKRQKACAAENPTAAGLEVASLQANFMVAGCSPCSSMIAQVLRASDVRCTMGTVESLCCAGAMHAPVGEWLPWRCG